MNRSFAMLMLMLCSITLSACQQQATQPHTQLTAQPAPLARPHQRLPLPPAPPEILAQACQDKTAAQATTLTVAGGGQINGHCQLMFVPDQPLPHPPH